MGQEDMDGSKIQRERRVSWMTVWSGYHWTIEEMLGKDPESNIKPIIGK